MEQAIPPVFPERETKEQVLEAAAIPCLNCGETLTGKYCNECGQWSGTSRLNLREILVNLWHSLTETDIGILHLVKELFLKPGYVAREYIEGKRRKYFNPWSFFVLASAAYVFAVSYSGYFKNIQTAKEQFELKSQQEAFGQVIVFFESHMKEFNFLFIPLLATACWLLYRKAKLNFAEHLVFQAYLYGQLSVVFIVVVLPFMLYPKAMVIINPIYTLWTFWFFMLGSKQLFQNSWRKTFLKTVALFGINFLIMASAAAVYVILFVLKE